MPTPKQYADALSATPRNSWKYLADAMQPVSEFADTFKVKQDIPLIGGMSAADFTGLKGAFGLADDASYGKYPIRGASLQTAKVDPRVIDAMGLAGALMPVAKNVGKAALGEVARQIHTGTGIGRAALDPRMNMFAGEGAKTADMEALKVANEMKASGVPDEAIHAKTGWFFGMPDNKPRFEIDDSGAKGQFTHLDAKNEKRVADQALAHPSLYKEYPELSKISQLGLKEAREDGMFDPSLNGLLVANAPNETGIKSVGLHELQHAIQQTEGFASGGTPKEFKNKRIPSKLKDVSFSRDMNEMAISQRLQKSGMGVGEGKYLSLNEPKTLAVAEELAKTDGVLAEALAKFKDANLKLSKYPSAHTQYRNLAGEAEARLTQSRMNMTAPERAASYPPSMFDVPVKDQIVRYGDDVARQKERK